MAASRTYIITTKAAAQDAYQTAGESAGKILADASAVYRYNDSNGTKITTGDMAAGDVIVMNAEAVAADIDADVRFKK